MKAETITLVCLLISASALATGTKPKALSSKTLAPGITKDVESNHASKPRARPCQDPSYYRTLPTQGSLLSGMARKDIRDEVSTVVASANQNDVRLRNGMLKSLRLRDGRLNLPLLGSSGLVGAVLWGNASDGSPVEVALCSVEEDPNDPTIEWYRIEVWDPDSNTWNNPCIATRLAPIPRVLAVEGVWDQSGARRKAQGRFTFACESGAIAKCIQWGYKPWEMKDGRSLETLHQACTRMARADYCGNGRSHTQEGTRVDVYDSLKRLTRATESTSDWNLRKFSFEAAWTHEGAWCLARTRNGRSLETIMNECPGRFQKGAVDLGEGDHCTVHRTIVDTDHPLLMNRSLDHGEQSQPPTGFVPKE